MIKLVDISKKFLGKTVVSNLNLSVGKGEIVGLLGPNGAGKTTTIRMITGTLPPSSGQIFIDGEDLSEHEEKKSLIGYLPENNPLYENLTVEEHLRFWADVKQLTHPSGSGQAIENGELIERAVKNLSLESVYYRPIAELSKGFKQRVGLSQALLSDPSILLLDEPTEGLDPNQRREIHELVLGLGQDRTVIVCSHVLSEINKMCSRVLIIHQGQLVADGTVKKITESGKFSLEDVFAKLTK